MSLFAIVRSPVVQAKATWDVFSGYLQVPPSPLSFGSVKWINSSWVRDHPRPEIYFCLSSDYLPWEESKSSRQVASAAGEKQSLQ